MPSGQPARPRRTCFWPSGLRLSFKAFSTSPRTPPSPLPHPHLRQPRRPLPSPRQPRPLRGTDSVKLYPRNPTDYGVSAVYLRVASANNSIVRDARVFLANPWSRRRLTMGPYSMDLRERVAAAIDEGEGSE